MDITALRDRDNIGSFTVSELNNFIKNLFESNRTLSAVTVKGEISNFTAHSSGHLYFSLKDKEGQIRAVMFRSSAARLRFMPESGMKVIVHGSVTVYPRDGSYQIYVNSMQPDGIGALYLAYEQLKERLAKEGIFDQSHKLAIPKMPKRIGVITSPTGAAIRDIINVTGRRFPLADLYIYPSLVQGEGAEENLVRAVAYFDKTALADVIIIGRGGGSIEDLWAFNSERLARRIYEATIPIISAVGHETDFTICDFAADLRAPTPSAAAELAVPDIRELILRIDSLSERTTAALIRSAANARERLERVSLSRTNLYMLTLTERCGDQVGLLRERAIRSVSAFWEDRRAALSKDAEKLTVMNPLSVLARGYSITEQCEIPIKSVGQLSMSEKIVIRLSDGKVFADITSISGGNFENE